MHVSGRTYSVTFCRANDSGDVYPWTLVAELFGIGGFTLREAEAEDAMKTLWFGKRKFVKGSELIAAMERQTVRRDGTASSGRRTGRCCFRITKDLMETKLAI